VIGQSCIQPMSACSAEQKPSSFSPGRQVSQRLPPPTAVVRLLVPTTAAIAPIHSNGTAAPFALLRLAGSRRVELSLRLTREVIAVEVYRVPALGRVDFTDQPPADRAHPPAPDRPPPYPVRQRRRPSQNRSQLRVRPVGNGTTTLVQVLRRSPVTPARRSATNIQLAILNAPKV
jgi:hypothetical protein